MVAAAYLAGLVACYFAGYKVGYIVKLINQLSSGA